MKEVKCMPFPPKFMSLIESYLEEDMTEEAMGILSILVFNTARIKENVCFVPSPEFARHLVLNKVILEGDLDKASRTIAMLRHMLKFYLPSEMFPLISGKSSDVDKFWKEIIQEGILDHWNNSKSQWALDFIVTMIERDLKLSNDVEKIGDCIARRIICSTMIISKLRDVIKILLRYFAENEKIIVQNRKREKLEKEINDAYPSSDSDDNEFPSWLESDCDDEELNIVKKRKMTEKRERRRADRANRINNDDSEVTCLNPVMTGIVSRFVNVFHTFQMQEESLYKYLLEDLLSWRYETILIFLKSVISNECRIRLLEMLITRKFFSASQRQKKSGGEGLYGCMNRLAKEYLPLRTSSTFDHFNYLQMLNLLIKSCHQFMVTRSDILVGNDPEAVMEEEHDKDISVIRHILARQNVYPTGKENERWSNSNSSSSISSRSDTPIKSNSDNNNNLVIPSLRGEIPSLNDPSFAGKSTVVFHGFNRNDLESFFKSLDSSLLQVQDSSALDMVVKRFKDKLASVVNQVQRFEQSCKLSPGRYEDDDDEDNLEDEIDETVIITDQDFEQAIDEIGSSLNALLQDIKCAEASKQSVRSREDSNVIVVLD